jgi:nucleoside-diphosphate-sugar epimerase
LELGEVLWKHRRHEMTDYSIPWNGYPEGTSAPYGLARKMLLVQSQAHRQEYRLNGLYLLPVNLYGLRENFDSETSHVRPVLIQRCLDASEAMVVGTAHYSSPRQVNFGSGIEIMIKELAEPVAELRGFTDRLVWNTQKPTANRAGAWIRAVPYTPSGLAPRRISGRDGSEPSPDIDSTKPRLNALLELWSEA